MSFNHLLGSLVWRPAHPSHVLKPQSDWVVSILVLAVQGLLLLEDPLVVQLLHEAALVVVQDGQGNLVSPGGS